MECTILCTPVQASLGPVLRSKIVIFQSIDKQKGHTEQDVFPKVAF